MSSIDDRIVRMSFDNAKFEAGAAKTISTLDRLDEKLQFKSATKGTQELQRSVNNVDFSAMERGIAALERRFSTFGIAGMNVINKITNGIVGSIAKIEQATIGQIESGGWARAMKIANAKFQIEGLGFDWSSIENAVSYGVKDTAYGLDAAASAASQLAASGVDFQNTLETVNGQDLTAMHKSLRAISGVAAMTNSSYEDIARIFTTVAGNGRLMGDQLLQLSSRGMNAAAKLAETLGTTESEIRSMVSKGQIDFQTFAFAMDDAFGEHAKEANKTFEGALGNMKAALSRVGEIFADPIINKTNTLFISLTGRIDELKNKLKNLKVPNTLEEIKKQYDGISMSATAYDEILKESSDRTVSFSTHFAEMWQSGINAFSAMIKAVDLSWFDKIVLKVDSVTVKLKEFFDSVKEYFGVEEEEVAQDVSETAKSLTMSAEEIQAAQDIILKGAYGNGFKRVSALTDAFGSDGAKRIQNYIDKVVAAGWSFKEVDKEYSDVTKSIKDNSDKQAQSLDDLKERWKDADLPSYALDAMLKAQQTQEAIANSVNKSDKKVKNSKLFKVFDTIKASFSNLSRAAGNIIKAITKIGSAVFKGFGQTFKMDGDAISGGIVNITEALADFTEKLIISDETAEKIARVSEKVFSVIKGGLGVVSSLTEKVITLVKNVRNVNILDVITNGVKKMFDTVSSFDFGGVFGSIKDGLNGIFDFSSFNISIENTPFKSIDNVFRNISDIFSSNSAITFVYDYLSNITWDDIGNGFSNFVDKVSNIISSIVSIKDTDTAKSIIEKIKSFFVSLWDSIKSINSETVIQFSDLAEALLFIYSINRIADGIDSISGAIETIMELPNSISEMFSNFGEAAKNAADNSKMLFISYIIKELGKTILEIGATILILGSMDTGALTAGLVAVALVCGIVIKIIDHIKKTIMTLSMGPTGSSSATPRWSITIKSLLKSFAAGLGATGILGGIVLVIAAVTALIYTISKIDAVSNIWAALLIVVGVIGLIVLTSAVLFKLSKASAASVDSWKKTLYSMLTLSSVIFATGSAVLALAAAVFVISKVDVNKMSDAIGGVLILLAGLVLLMAMVAIIPPARVSVGLIASFLAIGVLVGAVAGAVALLSLIPEDNLSRALSAMDSLTRTIVTICACIAIITSSISAGPFSVSGGGGKGTAIIGAFVGISVMLLVMVHAIKALADIDMSGIIKAERTLQILADTVISIMAVLGIVTLLLAVLAMWGSGGGAAGNRRESGRFHNFAKMLSSIGLAFVMVAASTLILAYAMQVLASVDSDGMTRAAWAFGILIVVVSAFVALGAIFPTFLTAMEKFGTMMIAVGIASIGFGAGMYLVAKGFSLIAASLGPLADGLSKLFPLMREYAPEVKLLLGFLIVILGALAFSIWSVTKSITTVLPVITSALSTFFGWITTGMGKVSGAVSTWFSSLSTTGKMRIVAIITTLCAALAEASPEMIRTIGTIIVNILRYLGYIAGDIAGALVVLIIELLNGLADAIRMNSARIVAAINNVLIALADLFVQAFGAILADLIAIIVSVFFGQWVSEDKILEWTHGIQQNAGKMSEALTRYAEAQKQYAEEADASKEEYMKALNGTVDDIDKASDSIEKSASKTSASSDILSGALSSINKGSGGGTGHWGEDIAGGITSIGTSANGATTAVTGFTKTLDNLKEEYAGAELSGYALDAMLRAQEAQFKANGKKSGNSYVDGFMDFASGKALSPEETMKSLNIDSESMSAYGADGADAYTASAYDELSAQSTADGYKDATSEGLEGVDTAIEEKKEDVKKAVQSSINEPAKAQIRGSYQSYYESGQYVVSGLVKAVNEDTTYEYAMGNLAARGKSAFDSTLAIESPSKEFYKNGEYIVQGLVNGIVQNEALATGAMGNLADTVFRAFGEPVDYVSKIASGELAYNPRIQPIMDTRSISIAAKQTGSMFEKQGISLDGYTGRLAADIGTLDRTNSDVVAELKQLRSDMLKMTDEIANMQMVMDTGALVGSISGPMDKSLGRRAVYKGRGN